MISSLPTVQFLEHCWPTQLPNGVVQPFWSGRGQELHSEITGLWLSSPGQDQTKLQGQQGFLFKDLDQRKLVHCWACWSYWATALILQVGSAVIHMLVFARPSSSSLLQLDFQLAPQSPLQFPRLGWRLLRSNPQWWWSWMSILGSLFPLEESQAQGRSPTVGCASLGEGQCCQPVAAGTLTLLIWSAWSLQPHPHVLGFSHWYVVHE